MQKILILGATSAIAEATARLYARRRTTLFLVARNAERLELVAADLAARGATVVGQECVDLTDPAGHKALIEAAADRMEGLDLVLVAHGVLPDQAACERDVAALRDAFEVNTLSVLSLLTHAANHMQIRRTGMLAALCSVAGDRGRRSNYVYGASKAALETFLSGLRNRLHAHGVHVLTIKPGFVDTPMTAAFPKGPLWVGPERIAAGIVHAVDRRRNVVYLPWFWRLIMLVIRAIPEPVFKRMSL